MDHIQINAIEKFHFDNFTRIAQDSNFKSDLDSIEKYIKTNYDKLHFHWGIKNKIKLPFVFIGGINHNNIESLKSFKPNNVAIIDSLWNFKHGPIQSALKFKESLEAK